MIPDQLEKNILALLAHFGYIETDIDVSYDDASHTAWFAITHPETRALFSRDAEGLSALNHIATKLAENLLREDTEHPRVIIDANNHEKRKIETLRTMAHMMAERARYFKSSVELDPLPPHERRIVHEFLAAMPDLKTESEGVGAKRHIVITYTGDKS